MITIDTRTHPKPCLTPPKGPVQRRLGVTAADPTHRGFRLRVYGGKARVAGL